MCSLCGMLGSRPHWTESNANPETFASRAQPHTRRRERQARTRLANQVLAHYDLKLDDFAGASFVLRTRTGRSRIVDNLAQVWVAAEQLTGSACDPLDEALVARLAARRG